MGKSTNGSNNSSLANKLIKSFKMSVNTTCAPKFEGTYRTPPSKKKSPPNRVRFMHGPRNRPDPKSPSNTGLLNIRLGQHNYSESSDSEESQASDDVTESESEEDSEVVSQHPMTLRSRSTNIGVCEDKKLFKEGVVEIGKNSTSDGEFKIQQAGVDILQKVAEKGIVDLFKKSGALAKTGGREEVTVTDMRAAKRIMNILQNSSD